MAFSSAQASGLLRGGRRRRPGGIRGRDRILLDERVDGVEELALLGALGAQPAGEAGLLGLQGRAVGLYLLPVAAGDLVDLRLELGVLLVDLLGAPAQLATQKLLELVQRLVAPDRVL